MSDLAQGPSLPTASGPGHQPITPSGLAAAQPTPPPLMTRPDAIAWLHHIFAPRVAIATTPDVKPLLAEYGLPSLQHFLAPFASAPTQVRDTATGNNVQSIPQFHVRFIDVSRVEDTRLASVAEELLADAVRGPDRDWDVPALEKYPTPWFSMYRQWLPHTFTATEHESLDHPAAFVFAVSTACPDPIAALSKLNNMVTTLPAYEKGWLDPGIFRHNLIVHSGEASDEVCRRVLDSVQRIFGPNLSVLALKRATSDSDCTNPELWAGAFRTAAYLSRFVPDPPVTDSAAWGAGVRIHPSTATSARAFVHSLINQSLVPYLERSAAHWNETVAAPRRGITGRLFTASRKYFGVGGSSGSSSRASTPSPIFGGSSSITPPSVTYTHTAQEALLRRLGDFALVLRDYKLALSVYQTAARAYSSDKAYRHLAAAQEMVSICHALLGQWSEVDTAHEQALTTYLTKARLPLSAARATVTLATLCAPDQPSLAASIYLRMASIDVDPNAPRVALFLEQAAQLYADIGYRRKCLIHLVLAGNKFAKSSLRLHAIRCYRVAQQLLPAKWDSMFDHVHLALGRQYYHMGDYGQAVQEMLKLVHSGQSMVLEELVYLYSQYPMAGPGKELEWHALEEGVPKVEIKKVDPICVHEKATVVLHITNLLLIPLSVCSPHLTFTTNAVPGSPSSTSPSSIAASDSLPPVIDVEIPTTSHSIECEPTVTVQAYLNVHGLRSGSATLTHLTYRMFDMIPIRVPLTKPVIIQVIPPRARLSVQWELPSVVFASQVMRVPTLLTNTGFVDSGPIGVRVVDPSQMGGAIGSVETVVVTVDNATPLPSSLAPGESAQVTLWTHWHASSAQVEWTYGQGTPGASAHVHVDVHPVAVTMVPLVNTAHAVWTTLSGSSPGLIVTIEALHQALEGTLVGTGISGGDTIDVAPRQAVTSLVRTRDVKGHLAKGSGPWPEWWDGPTNDLLLLPGEDGKFGQEGRRMLFAWTLNNWRGFLPIAIYPPPALDVRVEHMQTVEQLARVLLSIRVQNNGPAYAGDLRVRVEVSSDAMLIVTGLISQTVVLASGASVVLERVAIPMMDGVHDVAAAVSVSAQWVAGTQEELSPVMLEPSYMRVDQRLDQVQHHALPKSPRGSTVLLVPRVPVSDVVKPVDKAGETTFVPGTADAAETEDAELTTEPNSESLIDVSDPVEASDENFTKHAEAQGQKTSGGMQGPFSIGDVKEKEEKEGQ